MIICSERTIIAQTTFSKWSIQPFYSAGISKRQLEVNDDYTFPNDYDPHTVIAVMKVGEQGAYSQQIGCLAHYQLWRSISLNIGISSQSYSRKKEFSVFSDLIDPRKLSQNSSNIESIVVTDIDRYIAMPLGIILKIGGHKRLSLWTQCGLRFDFYFNSKRNKRYITPEGSEKVSDHMRIDEYRQCNMSPFIALGAEITIHPAMAITAGALANGHLFSDFTADSPAVQRWYSYSGMVGLRYTFKTIGASSGDYKLQNH